MTPAESFGTPFRPAAQRLQERWPIFSAQLRQALLTADRPALASQVETLDVADMCDCGDDFCQSFYTAPRVDAAIEAGPRGEALELEPPWPGFLIVDVLAGRIAHVEVIDRDPLD